MLFDKIIQRFEEISNNQNKSRLQFIYRISAEQGKAVITILITAFPCSA
jgi:hypothetical protein